MSTSDRRHALGKSAFPDPSECSHRSLTRYASLDDTVAMWACDVCRLRFYPACPTCVDVGHRSGEHEDTAEVLALRAARDASVVEADRLRTHHCHPPDTYFDRSLCGVHTRCSACGEPLDGPCAKRGAHSAAPGLHLDFCTGGGFCPLDECLCECHMDLVDLAAHLSVNPQIPTRPTP